LISSVLGSADIRGSSCALMFIPDERAVGGRKERKRRADRARGLKGLKRVLTSVMKRVIILVVVWGGVCFWGCWVVWWVGGELVVGREVCFGPGFVGWWVAVAVIAIESWIGKLVLNGCG
jgi:hypothetical protein